MKKLKFYMRMNKWIFIPFTLLCAYSAMAQNELTFRDPNISFSDNGIRAITEDYKGFMWFGTQSGLNCYDGVNMKIYNKKINDTTSLVNNSILSLFESSRKELWIGTSNGISKYNREKDNFLQFIINKNKSDLNSNYIVNILEDNDGDIWFSTRGGVYIYIHGENNIKSFSEHTGSTEPEYKSLSNFIAKDKQGRILGITIHGTLVIYNKSNGEIQEYFFDNGKKNNRLVFASSEFTSAQTDYIWLCTSDIGLVQITEIKNGHVYFNLHQYNKHNTNSISWNSIFTVNRFNENAVLIGTENGGLNLYNYKEQKFTRYIANDEPNQGISGNSIWSIHNDSRNNIWIGIFNHGVNLINNIPQKFNSKSYSVLNPDGIANGAITAFFEDEKQNIWITLDGGGVDYWDREKDIFKHFKHQSENNKTLSSNAALCICKPNESELWIGCWDGGINILKNQGNSISHLNTSKGLSSNNVFSLAQRKNGLVYIGTYGGGVDVCDPLTKKVTPLMHDSLRRNEPIYKIVNVLYVDNDDNLWVGYEDGGVDKYTWNKDDNYSYVHYQNNPSNLKSISDNSILTINQDGKGNIWLGTRDGVNIYNKYNDSFSAFRISDGLPSNTVVGVIEDNKGAIWISTLNGLSMFNTKDSSFTNYTTSDGLQSLKFSNRNAIYKNKNGELFLGNNEGFTFFNPDEIKYDRTFPKIYFVDFKLFNKPVPIDQNSPLPKQITELSEIRLKYNQSVFTIEYVAVNFTAPEKIKYAFRLNGLESEWNYVGSKREANYTNLDQGEYLFQVKSTNIEGDWNTEVSSLKIIILPAWYETILVRVLIAMAFALILYLIYLFRVRGIKKKQKELEIAKDKAEESDRLKTAFLANMSHEIRTPMNAIVGFSQLLHDPDLDEESKTAYLAQISSSSSSLLYLIEDIIDLSKIEANQMIIDKKPFDLIALLKEIHADAAIINENKNLDLILNINSQHFLSITSDKYRIKQILLNLFNNACKFTEEGSVELGIKVSDETICCYVKDTGIGISEENQKAIFSRFRKFADGQSKVFRGAGLGLAISKRISELLGAELTFKSELGKGSEFKLILPENIRSKEA